MPPSPFDELGVSPELITALAKQKISEPTAIQISAVPVLRSGKDAYLCAETGTGKTLAYLLPLVARVDPASKHVQVVILAPSHELAIQIHRQCCDLAQNSGLAFGAVLLIGGTPVDRQLEKLKRKPQVVVGSPGRIAELVAKGKLKVHQVRSVVIDEADRVIVPEAMPAVNALLRAAPRDRQLVFVSATVQEEVSATIAAIAPALEMLKTAAAPVSANIEHLYLPCEERDKPDLVRKLVHALKPERAIVFVHRNETADILVRKLDHHQVRVTDLHSAIEKEDRRRSMQSIRSGEAQVLVASDIAARGLDIPGVTHVINLDAPTTSKVYLHRVGRTGRAGANGCAVTLITERDLRLISRYSSELGIVLKRVELSHGRVVAGE